MNGDDLFQGIYSASAKALALLGSLATLASAPAHADECELLAAADSLRNMPIESIQGHLDGVDAAGESLRYRVDSVEILRQPVFEHEAAADRALFRLANRWHVHTREALIRALLLFAEGDVVTERVIAESERLLRARPFLADARIVAKRRCGQRVELIVVTRDVWSRLPSIGGSRTGGKQTFEVGLSDINLLGTGTSLDIEFFDDLDRSGLSFGLASDNLRSIRIGARLRFDDTEDGDGAAASIGLPFYALDARRAWQVSVSQTRRQESLFDGGEKSATFAAERRFAELSAGWSKGLVDGGANRLRVGFSFDDQRLAPLDGPLDGLADRVYAYPWVSFAHIEDAFVRTRNLNRVQTTEDVLLGRQATALVGYSPRGVGRAIVNASYRNGAARRDGEDILRYGAEVGGAWRLGDGRAENLVGAVWLSYRRGQGPRSAMVVDAQATAASGLTTDRRLYVGGDNGLRGYPNRFQAGNRRLRVSAEQRYYTDLYLLRSVRVAAAAFLDFGAAWRRGDAPSLLANVGVGLRLESTRTNRDVVYHVDVARPLVDGPGVRGLELTLTSKRNL